MLEYYLAELLDCLEVLVFWGPTQWLMLLHCLRKHAWHIYSTSWIIQYSRTHLLAHSHILKTEMCLSAGQDRPDSKSLWEELIEKDRKPAAFSWSHQFPIKQIFYSILRQDATGTPPKGMIIKRWKVHGSIQEEDLRVKKNKVELFLPEREWHSPLITEKIEDIWKWGKAEKERDRRNKTVAYVSGRKTIKRSRRHHSQGDTAIKAPTWQDVTCGEQEKETGQI